ncbi:MAG: hypothetical protein KDC65_13525 [Saprospiraceae bacterium]|nr:hypothetical protein [Saprospiraceae bacterium]
MNTASDLTQEEWHRRTDAALIWLRHCWGATDGKGFSHSYSPFSGWSKAYPETSGYLIDTLFDYARLRSERSLTQLALQCTDWLVSVQFPNGAYPALLAGNKKPSVFNTAMILLGLTRAFEENDDISKRSVLLSSLQHAVTWLINQLEPDGSWKKHAYVEGFTPNYYAYAVWAMLRANSVLNNPDIEERMRQAIGYYANGILGNGAVSDAGFFPGKPAFTHTMGYTFNGFLESAVLLSDENLIEKKILTGEKFIAIMCANRYRTAGRYDAQWRGDYSFLCLTGNCQLSVFCSRLWEITGREEFRQTARELLNEVVKYQKLSGPKCVRGALPGSYPFWGPYMRFRYPNWGVKFFLDAMFKLCPSGDINS